jgi:hypothetical protein
VAIIHWKQRFFFLGVVANFRRLAILFQTIIFCRILPFKPIKYFKIEEKINRKNLKHFSKHCSSQSSSGIDIKGF